ncbi:MAG: AAA family ATPase [Methyloligellaceae bacterium]
MISRSISVLTIVQGFIGAGKTTWSKKLAHETGALRLNADEFCEENFTARELEENWEECFSSAVDKLWCIAQQELKNGNNVILDFGFWSYSSRQQARKLASDLNIHFRHIYINTPDNILLERLKARSGQIAKKNLDNFDCLKEQFEPPNEDEINSPSFTAIH